jgi:hypothetical protein
MESYFDYNSKSTSWDVLELEESFEVEERELTEEEVEAFRRAVNESL